MAQWFQNSEVRHMFLNRRGQVELLSTAYARLPDTVVADRYGPAERASFHGLVTSEREP
jgi:hypothetical protein